MTTGPFPAPAPRRSAPDRTGAERPGRIEARGIDYIPDQERHGRPRELFAVWAASNMTYLYIVLGGTMVLLGLNAWQSLAVVLAGNVFWLLVGWLSVSGPSSGTPSEVVTRAMYGIRGNRAYNALVGWAVGVAYEAINLSVGALAGFALVEQWGGSATAAVKWAIVLGIALFTISVYGHATIVRFSGWFTWILLAGILLLGFYVLRHAHWSYQTPDQYAVHGAALWAVAAAGFTIIASAPLSWGVGADYARYLPASTSRRAVVGWTALGGVVPAVLLAGLGVLAGTAADMTDPQAALKTLLPGWFYPAFLLLIVAGSITNNAGLDGRAGHALVRDDRDRRARARGVPDRGVRHRHGRLRRRVPLRRHRCLRPGPRSRDRHAGAGRPDRPAATRLGPPHRPRAPRARHGRGGGVPAPRPCRDRLLPGQPGGAGGAVRHRAPPPGRV
jgi:permease for cytosine/purines